MGFLEYLSRKQQMFDMKTYEEVIKLIKSPEMEVRLMVLMTLTNFSLFNEDNKPYFESIFVHYDTYFHDLKHSREYLYFTNGHSTYNKTQHTKERWII